MAAEVSSALELPVEGSLYWDYLLGIPVGERIDIHLSSEPAGTLGADEESELIFTVKRVGSDGWVGVKNDQAITSTRALFEHVQAVLAEDDEDVIRVAHGRDPMKVKREIIDGGGEPEPIKFWTVNEVIELDSDSEEGDDAGAGVGIKQPTAAR